MPEHKITTTAVKYAGKSILLLMTRICQGYEWPMQTLDAHWLHTSWSWSNSNWQWGTIFCHNCWLKHVKIPYAKTKVDDCSSYLFVCWWSRLNSLQFISSKLKTLLELMPALFACLVFIIFLFNKIIVWKTITVTTVAQRKFGNFGLLNYSIFWLNETSVYLSRFSLYLVKCCVSCKTPFIQILVQHL